MLFVFTETNEKGYQSKYIYAVLNILSTPNLENALLRFSFFNQKLNGTVFNGNTAGLSRVGKCWKMVSFVFYLWILLTTVISAICCFSILQPFWIVHPDSIHSFGLQNYCKMSSNADTTFHRMERTCIPYGGALLLGNIPSGAWRAAFLLLSSGCVLLIFSVPMGVLVLCLSGKWQKKLSTATTYTQTTAVIILASALFVYPLGFNSLFFRYYCGKEATLYNASQCNMGWSYMLVTMGTALSVFCPILWSFKGVKRETYDAGISV